MRPTRMSWRSSVLQPLALKFLSCRHRLFSCVLRLRRSSAPLAKSSNATFPTRRRFTHDVAGGCRRVSGGSTTPTVLSACWAFDAQGTSAACWKRYARTADCCSPIGLRSDRLKKVPPDTAPASAAATVRPGELHPPDRVVRGAARDGSCRGGENTIGLVAPHGAVFPGTGAVIGAIAGKGHGAGIGGAVGTDDLALPRNTAGCASSAAFLSLCDPTFITGEGGDR